MYPGFPFVAPPKVNVPPPKPTTRPDGTPLYEYRLWSYNGLLDDAERTEQELGDMNAKFGWRVVTFIPTDPRRGCPRAVTKEEKDG